MALSSFIGTLNPPTATGNQSITGVGFQPKVVIFFGSLSTINTAAVAARAHFGVGVSSTDRLAFSTWDNDSSPTNQSRRRVATACISYVTTDEVVRWEADLVTMDSDGFTLNWSTVQGTSEPIQYLALGGTDISNVTTGNFNLNTTTGNQAVTGVGFQPKLVLFFANRADTTAGSLANTASAFGVAISSLKRWAASFFGQDAFTTTNENSGWSTNRCITGMLSTAVFAHEEDFVSMDADGFTVNIVTAPGTARTIGFLALAGDFQVNIGTFTQPTTTGNQAVTGVGFQPEVVLHGSSSQTATGVAVNSKQTFGVAKSSLSRRATTYSAGDNVAAAQTGRITNDDNFISHLSGNTPTIDAQADFVSQDSDGFTINWGTADASARLHGYLALRTQAAAGGGTTNNFLLLGIS